MLPQSPIFFAWFDRSPGPAKVEIVDYHQGNKAWHAPLSIQANTSPSSSRNLA
jgi:hypothetical protein